MGYIYVTVLVVYFSDDGNQYNVGMRADKATAGGFTPAGAGALPNYPRAWRMRHVWVKNSQGQRAKLYVSSASNSLFEAGGTASWTGFTGTVQGREGEKRPARI